MDSGKAQTTVGGPTSNSVCIRYMRPSVPLDPIGENVCSNWLSVAWGRDSWELLLEPNDSSGVGSCRTLRSPFVTHSPRHSGLKPDQQALPGLNAVRGDSGRMSPCDLVEGFNEGVRSER